MAHVIALDIGGTNIRAAIINEKYRIIKVIRKATLTGSVDLFLKQVVDIIEDLDYKPYAPQAIVMGVPGRVRKDGFIEALPNIRIENIPLREYIEYYFKIPAFVKNDAEMAGLAEGVVGQGASYFSSFFITISTGIGGCYIENKQIKQVSNEIGHTLFPYQGQYYELEKIASGSGIVRLAAINGITIEHSSHMFERMRINDLAIFPVFQDWLKLISDFLQYVQKTFEPKVIIFTGGVMKSADVFMDQLKLKNPNLNLAMAKFDQDAGLIGSACYGFLKLK
ncbi:MAG: ROK family protein [Methanomicrobia archaeon]|nr:ROK family protein [Methanomicrobia archaeon]